MLPKRAIGDMPVRASPGDSDCSGRDNTRSFPCSRVSANSTNASRLGILSARGTKTLPWAPKPLLFTTALLYQTQSYRRVKRGINTGGERKCYGKRALPKRDLFT